MPFRLKVLAKAYNITKFVQTLGQLGGRLTKFTNKINQRIFFHFGFATREVR